MYTPRLRDLKDYPTKQPYKLINPLLSFSSLHHVALLTLSVFILYYYTIFSVEFIHLDDIGLINRLLNAPPIQSLKTIFFTKGLLMYYRPLVELSYRLDYFLWADIPSGYHLTNVFLHAVNTVLVYALIILLSEQISSRRAYYAFIASLLFACSPLAVEPISWISGRYDLLATTFFISSFIFYIRCRRNKRIIELLISGFLFLLASSAKETGLAIPPLVISCEIFYARRFWKEPSGIRSSVIIIFFIALTIVFFTFFRSPLIQTSTMDLGVGISGIRTVSLTENILTGLASFGFYVKKIIIPWPLNLAIAEIHTVWYAALGIVCLLLFVWYGIIRTTPYSLFIFWFIITVAPAIGAAVLNIPWVPWAERYLYLPSVGLFMATAHFAMNTRLNNRIIAGLSVLLVVYCLTSFQRTIVWSDEVALWEDTSHKSSYAPVKHLYGTALFRNGRTEEGIRQINKSIEQGFIYVPSLTLSQYYQRAGQMEKGEQTLLYAISMLPNKPELHMNLAEYYLKAIKNDDKKNQFYSKAIEQYEKYVSIESENVEALYRLAQLYRRLHYDRKAVPLLKRLMVIAPGSTQAGFAKKILKSGNSDVNEKKYQL
jgi:hypothetical protein